MCSSLWWNSSFLVMNESKHTRQWKCPSFRLHLFFILESGMEAALRFFVWVFLCSCSWFSSTNCSWHIVHVGTGHNPMCWVSEAISRSIRWHLGHLKRMVWQMVWCCFKLSLRLNVFPQSVHSCFTPSWRCLAFICRFRWSFLVKLKWHKAHTCLGIMLMLKFTLQSLTGKWRLWVWWGCIYSGSIYSMPSITFQSALFPMPELPINHIPRVLVLDLNHLLCLSCGSSTDISTPYITQETDTTPIQSCY